MSLGGKHLHRQIPKTAVDSHVLRDSRDRTSPQYPQAEAITWFGRALGAARSGDLAGARLDLGEIARLRGQLAAAHDSYWTEQLVIQRKAAGAWIALGEKNLDAAIESMREAADREDRTEKHVAMENRLSPMREVLGELLLEAQRPAEAVQQFEMSLRTPPRIVFARWRVPGKRLTCPAIAPEHAFTVSNWWHLHATLTAHGRPSPVPEFLAKP